MEYKSFVSALAKIEKIPLPGHIGLEGLSPSDTHQRWAGVLCLFYPDARNHTHFVLIRRQRSLGPHSGQIAFPGGRRETSDNSMVDTAVRECEEEIGINKNDICVTRAMSQLYVPPSDYWVQPYIGTVDYCPKFVLQQSEVAGLIHVQATHLLDNDRISMECLNTTQRRNIDMPVFDFDGNRVWGATAMMLFEIRKMLKQIM